MWLELDDFCKKEHIVFLKVEPDQWESEKEPLQQGFPGFKAGAQPIQPRQTIVLSLLGTEEEWLERMKQKTRYNIRLAEKKEIQIVESDRVDVFNELMHATGERDAFGIHEDTYYQRAYDLFKPDGLCTLLLAMYGDAPLAGLMIFKQGKRAWYLYGASNDHERNRMPTYLLQWAAMQWAKRQGCEEYDLWGIPDAAEEILEKDFTSRNDGLWGVYRFKRGYGGEIKRTAGAWDKVYNKPMYLAYLAYTHKES
jgi:lipid II:glycine glycyltransferase (peptidoglycan interpeptide bridge formation enzyme)